MHPPAGEETVGARFSFLPPGPLGGSPGAAGEGVLTLASATLDSPESCTQSADTVTRRRFVAGRGGIPRR